MSTVKQATTGVLDKVIPMKLPRDICRDRQTAVRKVHCEKS